MRLGATRLAKAPIQHFHAYCKYGRLHNDAQVLNGRAANLWSRASILVPRGHHYVTWLPLPSSKESVMVTIQLVFMGQPDIVWVRECKCM